MSGPFGSSQWMYQSARDFYEFPIEQSLKFNDDDSSYLSWTPASAGNRKTWTWSGWVKRSSFDRASYDYPLFISRGTAFTAIAFAHSGKGANLDRRLFIYDASSGMLWNTAGVQRDTSAWYHIVVSVDTTQSTSTNRLKVYINGVQQTNGGWNTYPSQNADTAFSSTQAHHIGRDPVDTSNLFDGYLAEVNFIDGQALDASSFGEFKSGVWIPKDPSGLTYGTNGFRLSFQNDTVSEGFNTVTYTGNRPSSNSVGGIGFQPDLVWIKNRQTTDAHILTDAVRGTTSQLYSNSTAAETAATNGVQSLDADGFTVGDGTIYNTSGEAYVAWCWDAGSGSPVSNTSGSITSTVKANAAYGFSIISYTGTGSNATVGHGLSSAPEMIIHKNRDNGSANWVVYVDSLGAGGGLRLNTTGAFVSNTLDYNNTAPTSSVFSVGNSGNTNQSGNNIIAYAFHSVAGYSKVGSYSGSGATGNAVTTGFKPAFVMVKRTDSTSSWTMLDNTRGNQNRVYANLSNAESTTASCDFTDTGFELTDANTGFNASSGTYIYIAFADTRDNAFWRDQSGNGNDWQPNNLTYQDSLPDSTTNNFAVLNTLNEGKNCSPTPMTFQEGNLECFYNRSTSGGTYAVGTMAMPNSGKWYAEMLISAGEYPSFGVASVFQRDTISSAQNARAYGAFNGNKLSWDASGSVTVNTGYGASFGVGDVVGIAADMDTGELTFYKNGVSQGVAFTDLISSGVEWTFLVQGTGGNTATSVVNFGQDSSFAGNKPAQGNTDDNGIGDFYYAPPSGHLALAASNLPSPVIDPAQDDVPSDYFNTVTWTGTGSTQQLPLDFTADFVWAKRRNGADSHVLYDFIRGENVQLTSNSTAGDATNDYGLDFLGHDYLEVDGTKYFGGGGGGSPTFVAWNWLAGNGTSSNTSGTISSTVSVNQKAGFSVVSYTGNGTAGATVGHSLGAAPSVLIVKSRDSAYNWVVYHKANGASPAQHVLFLNGTTADTVSSGPWNDTAPTSSVFTLGSGVVSNNSGDNYIAYCFAEVEGFSRFGSFVGNDNADGPFVYLGFRPSLLILKNASAAQPWVMIDSTRSTYNVSANKLYPNASDPENSTSTDNSIDFLSNGFKPRGDASTNDATNGPSNTIIYMAFAENPFKYANAR